MDFDHIQSLTYYCSPPLPFTILQSKFLRHLGHTTLYKYQLNVSSLNHFQAEKGMVVF